MTTRSHLEDALAELARTPPRDFTKVRQALAARLKGKGDGAAAAKIRSLRKPTAVVSAINRLAIDGPKVIDDLIDATERLRAAQLGRGGELDAAMTTYREAVEHAIARGEILARGAPRAPRLRLEQTLRAAAADPKLRKALRAGRLERELPFSGFEVFGAARPASSPPRGPTRARPARPPSPRAEKREARAQARAEAREAAEQARAAAAERLGELRRRAESAAQAEAQARADLQRATTALRTATANRRRAEREVRAAKPSR